MNRTLVSLSKIRSSCGKCPQVFACCNDPDYYMSMLGAISQFPLTVASVAMLLVIHKPLMNPHIIGGRGLIESP